jgi:hypothetical protein
MSERVKTPPRARGLKTRRWSAEVTKHSDALDLERDVFKSNDPHKIALSLALRGYSKRRKGTPYQSAMSMLNFYINRAGKNLPETEAAFRTRQRRIAGGIWTTMNRRKLGNSDLMITDRFRRMGRWRRVAVRRGE